MTTNVRPFSVMFHDIMGHIQEIVRLELRLARTEVREECGKAATASAVFGVGAVSALCGVLFVLLAAVYGLALVIPRRGAALIVGIVLVLAGVVMVRVGVARWAQVDPVPAKTIGNVKEQIEWSKRRLR